MHAPNVPVIGCIAFTVTVVVTKQPAAIVYVIVAVPPATPVTIPETVPTVALAVLLLLHVPPVTASVNVEVDPAHIITVPLIAVGVWLIVTIDVAKHPVARV